MAQAQPTTTLGDGFWDRVTDARVNEFYLLRGGPDLMLAIISLYLTIVLYLGPKLMARHEPFKLNRLLFVYNNLMAAANLYLFIQGMRISNYSKDTWGCGKDGGDVRNSPRQGIYLGYIFFLTKLIELLDTVFFVLRKKKQQITFLHVFHHSIVPFFCWIGIKLAPGGSNGFFPLVNSFIHVIMYSYYGLSTFGPKVQPYLWWKKYLTRLQMLQFVLVMINAAYTFTSTNCKFPIMFLYMQGSMAAIFLVLFAIFYKNAYHYRRREIAERTKLKELGAPLGDKQQQQQGNGGGGATERHLKALSGDTGAGGQQPKLRLFAANGKAANLKLL